MALPFWALTCLCVTCNPIRGQAQEGQWQAGETWLLSPGTSEAFGAEERSVHVRGQTTPEELAEARSASGWLLEGRASSPRHGRPGGSTLGLGSWESLVKEAGAPKGFLKVGEI